MAFFDDFKKVVTETASDFGKKAGDTFEIQKRKSDIRSLKRANDRDYADMGKMIFDKYQKGEGVEGSMASLCEAISQRLKEQETIQAEIDRIAGNSGGYDQTVEEEEDYSVFEEEEDSVEAEEAVEETEEPAEEKAE